MLNIKIDEGTLSVNIKFDYDLISFEEEYLEKRLLENLFLILNDNKTTFEKELKKRDLEYRKTMEKIKDSIFKG